MVFLGYHDHLFNFPVLGVLQSLDVSDLDTLVVPLHLILIGDQNVQPHQMGIVETPTQLQLKKIGFNMKMTLTHFQPPHPPTRNSMSAIFQMLRIQF